VERENLTLRTKRARALRRASTDAEWKVWSILRNRQVGGLKFRRQLPIGRYFADFACVEAKLIVEIDGSQHAENAEADAVRTGEIEIMGWRVIRVWNNDALTNPAGVADLILAEVKSARR
jgi:very-short-patch-repair endonuclease